MSAKESPKTIVQKCKEVAELATKLLEANDALLNHPALDEVSEFYESLKAFTTGQPLAAVKPIGTKRKRRTKEEIEAERARALAS